MHWLLIAALLAADSQPASTSWRAAFLLTRAGDAFANKRYDEAENLFKSLLKIEPDNEVAFIHLAAIANKKGDRLSAVAYLSTAVRSHPKSFAVVHELGIALNASGKSKEAITHLRTATELQPDSFDAAMNLGDAYAQLNQVDDALVSYERALALRKDNPIAMRQAGYAAFRHGEPVKAVRYLEAAKKLVPNEWAVWLALGHAQAALGNDTSALQSYDTVIKLMPRLSAGYLFAGNMLDRMAKKKEAEARYRDAIRVDPRDALARVHLGNLMRRDGRTIAAEREYESALRIDPNQVWAMTQLGFVLFERHENKRAERLLARALELAPNDNDVEVALGDLYAQRGRSEEAEIRFRRVLGRAPTHLAALVKLADSLQKRGKSQDARTLYERAATVHPKSAWALIALGDNLRSLGALAEAEARYLQAIEADPGSAWAVRQLGYVYFDLARYQDCVAALLKAAPLYPEEVGIPLVMGHAQRKLKHPELALQLYEKAAAIDPKNPVAKMFLAVALSDAKRFSDAVDQFQRALSFDPKMTEAWVLLGDTATQARKESPERMTNVARKAYERALELQPRAPWPLRQLGYLEFMTGNVERARELLAQVAEQFPEDVEIALILGHAAKAKGQLADARTHYERAVKTAPNDVRTHVFYGSLLRDQGELRASHRALLQAVAVAPQSAWAHYERAQTLFELRRLPQAVLAVEKATELDKTSRDAWLFLGRLRQLSRHYDDAVRAYSEAAHLDAEYAPGQIGYAAALMSRDRPGDLVEAGDRAQIAVEKLPEDQFTQLVTGAVFTRLFERKSKNLVKLRGQDTSLGFDEIAQKHLSKAVALAPKDQVTRLSAATSMVLLQHFTQALDTLEPLLAQGRPLCPAREWEVTWQLEQTKPEALLTPRTVEEQRLLPQRDRVAIAYMLAGDIENKRADRKAARLRYACSAAIQPERPEAHLQLGFAYEADAFFRLAEEHYVLAQKLVQLTLDKPKPASMPASQPSDDAPIVEMEVDETRTTELKNIQAVANDAVGRLRKEAGYPVLPWLRLSGETGFASDALGPEIMARLSTLLIAQGLDPALALTVPRTFYTMAGVAAKPLDWRNAPRFELQYRFFREEGTFWNDRQTIEPRLGHLLTAGAYGVIPLRLAETELRYWAEEKITYANSTSRQEVRSNTSFRARFTQFRLGSVEAITGYEFGAFIPNTTSTFFGLPPDTGAHTVFTGVRVEPQLRKYGLQAGVEYRMDQTILVPSGRRVWGHAVQLDLSSRLGDWFVGQNTRFGFAATDYIPEAIPTVFSYLLKVRSGRYFGDFAQVGGHVSIAGTGNNHVFDTVSLGVDGGYRNVWPKISNQVHTGFNAFAAYELRIAYNLPRVDHLITVGLSFAR